jgi:uncharacterized protein (TIGR00251 family)
MPNLLLHILVQPRASRSEIVGPHGDALKVRLTAPPVDGAANEELIRFLAKEFGVPQRAIEIVAGLSSRRKTVRVMGVTREEVQAVIGRRS